MLYASIPIVRNIKIAIQFDTKKYSTKILKNNIDKKGLIIKHYHNFSVLRSEFVYSVFWSSGYVNITKIPSLEAIEKSKDQILRIMNICPEDLILNHSVQNICASGSFSQSFNLHEIGKRWDSEQISLRKNLSAFPAIFAKCNNLGTCVLFQNGKYSLVGVRKEINLEPLLSLITCQLQKNELQACSNWTESRGGDCMS